MKATRGALALTAAAVAVSAVITAIPAPARAEVKDCAGDTRTMRVALVVYRMTGLGVFYDIAYRAADRNKFYGCNL
jgi:hypothetical protein